MDILEIIERERKITKSWKRLLYHGTQNGRYTYTMHLPWQMTHYPNIKGFGHTREIALDNFENKLKNLVWKVISEIN